MLRQFLGLFVLIVVADPVVGGRAASAIRCDPTGADAAAIAAARADVAANCNCSGSLTHSAYVRCSAGIVNTRLQNGQLPVRCRTHVQRCALRSTCGRPNAVSCCVTSATGNTHCRIRRDAAHCTAGRGGAACVGYRTSCCDACTAMGCVLATPTVTPTPSATPTVTPTPTSCTGPCLQTVFIVVMENHNWSQIWNSPSAPYIRNSLLPIASYTTQYYNPPGIHPSEPNYLWLEAGTGFGIHNDQDPLVNHQSTTNHLVTLLDAAGISWKTYQEDISGTDCPLIGQGLYAPKHNPFVFFDDVTNQNDPQSAYCIAHVRPYTELSGDLQNATVGRYNFITPNLCNDMHDSCPPLNNSIAQGDTWLSTAIPPILQSPAYQDKGAIFITWDEAAAGDGPIGMIVLSPQAKGGGYFNSIPYTHSSTLRSLQEIFAVTPLLGDAANATDLSDLFVAFP